MASVLYIDHSGTVNIAPVPETYLASCHKEIVAGLYISTDGVTADLLREALGVAGAAQLQQEVDHFKGQIKQLADFFRKEHPSAIHEGGAVDNAIRYIRELAATPSREAQQEAEDLAYLQRMSKEKRWYWCIEGPDSRRSLYEYRIAVRQRGNSRGAGLTHYSSSTSEALHAAAEWIRAQEAKERETKQLQEADKPKPSDMTNAEITAEMGRLGYTPIGNDNGYYWLGMDCIPRDSYIGDREYDVHALTEARRLDGDA